MSNFTEEQAGWIDFYHGKRFNEGHDNAPIYEGRIKLTRDLKKGEEIRVAVWPKVKKGVTKDEMFSGKVSVGIVE